MATPACLGRIGGITTATQVTLVRAFLIPFIVMAIRARAWSLAAGITAGALVSDIVDGYIARRWQQETRLGAMLDPLVDKLLVITVGAALAAQHLVPSWLVLCITIKEGILVLGALLLWWRRGSVHIVPTVAGKLTAGIQMFFIMGVLMGYPVHQEMTHVIVGVSAGIVLLQVIVLLQYGVSALLVPER